MAIILLVLALITVLLILAWCFRTKIRSQQMKMISVFFLFATFYGGEYLSLLLPLLLREFSEPYIDTWQQKARKPSTVR